MQQMQLDDRRVRLPGADHRFPRVLSCAADEAVVKLQLDVAEDLCWFRGHFPQQPVLPGIVQLHWAVMIVQACFDFSAPPVEIKRLKFKKVVTPPQVLELSISPRGNNEAQFAFCTADAQNSEGRLVFAGAMPC